MKKMIVSLVLLISILLLTSGYGKDNDKETDTKVYQPQYSKDFPFFGAGNASYFEDMGLTIVFKNIPTTKQKEKILTIMKPIFGNLEYEWHLLHLSQSYTYEGMEAIFQGEFKNENSYIEKSLLDINLISPIRFVYRFEDTEAAGTAFSKWHKDSCAVIDTTIESMEKELKSLNYKEVDTLKTYLNESLDVCRVESTRLDGPAWNPWKDVIKTNLKVVIDKIDNAKTNEELGTILWFIYKKNLYQKDTFYRIFKESTNTSIKEALEYYGFISQIISYAQSVKDTKVLQYFNEEIIVKTFDGVRSSYLNNKGLITYAEVYFPLLPKYSPKVKTEAIREILSRFINPRYKIPIHKERNHLLITHALPYGESDAEIYDLIARMYSQMNEYDKAYETLNKIFETNNATVLLNNVIAALEEGSIDGYANVQEDEKFKTFLTDFKAKVKEYSKKPDSVHPDAVYNIYDQWVYSSPSKELIWNKNGGLVEEKHFLKNREFDEELKFWYNENYTFINYHTDGTVKEKGTMFDSATDSYLIGEHVLIKSKSEYAKDSTWFKKISTHNNKGEEQKATLKYFDVDGVLIPH